MAKRHIIASVAIAMASPVVSASPNDVISGCLPITIGDAAQLDVPRFDQYPVADIFHGTPAPVNLSSHHQARRYRTTLRNQANGGPNFAGHFTIAGWGCGSSCVQFALIDATDGHVDFPKGFETVSTVHVGDSPDEPAFTWSGLRYRIDSRLMIVIGAPNEDETREGIAYYEWDGGKFRMLHFVRSAKRWCNDG